MGYMGWVPKSSRPGDFIIVLYGCSMLFTVRETNGKYVLLGTSYLEGFMDGEALKLKDAGPEEFVLELYDVLLIADHHKGGCRV